MKKTLLAIICFLGSNFIIGQNKDKAEKIVGAGVAYHDKGDFAGAIAKYDEALQLDPDNLLALAEKSMSLISLQKFDEAIQLCQLALTKHPEEKDLKTVYVNYGVAFNGLKKTEEALEIYSVGIKQFPDFFQLHFNKGVTLAGLKKYDEAILCFQRSALLNPKHASSHNGLSRLLDLNSKRIPALLAYCRFLVIEPESKRAKENLGYMKNIANGNVEKTGKNSITINISPDMLSDTTSGGKPKENSFQTTDFILAMSAALDMDKKNKKKTEVQLFIKKFDTVCSSIKETKKDNYGFYWDYYVPYFIEMKEKNLIETFAYIAFASSGDPDVSKWLKANKNLISKFYDWSNGFAWPVN